MNANGPLLAGLGRQFSMDVVMEESIPDDRAATVEAISTAVDRADIVVLSGGVSVGDCDFVGAALADAGLCVHFSAVAVKPGRPLTFAIAGRRCRLRPSRESGVGLRDVSPICPPAPWRACAAALGRCGSFLFP